jgi:arylsulfatase A-like enzyme
MSSLPIRSNAFESGYNVLFITVDQFRAECISSLGHPFVRTPNFDRLIQDSVTFERHYSQAVPCGPSRSSLHTSLYAHNHRSIRNGTPLDARFTNWALEARKIGYDPVLFGYTDITLDPRGLPTDHPARRTYQGILPGLRPVMVRGCFFWHLQRYEVLMCLCFVRSTWATFHTNGRNGSRPRAIRFP